MVLILSGMNDANTFAASGGDLGNGTTLFLGQVPENSPLAKSLASMDDVLAKIPETERLKEILTAMKATMLEVAHAHNLVVNGPKPPSPEDWRSTAAKTRIVPVLIPC